MKKNPPAFRARESTVSAALLVDLLRYLERSGFSPADVCRQIQADPATLEQPNARVPGSLMERLWELASELLADPNIGLHSAENFNPGALNILSYVLLSCRTAREALARLADYAGLINDGLEVRVTDHGGRTRCHFDIVGPLDNYLVRSPRHAMEAMACGTLITMRRLTTSPIEPLDVAFRHPAPLSGISEHLRLFHSVRFGQTEDRIEFRATDLQDGLLSANPVLLDVFDRQARQLLDQLGQRGPVSQRVLALLARRIRVEVPSLEEVAVELAMSERTLQRELRAEATSFRQLVEDIRKEIAMQHLAQPGASAAEASFLLGFSEPSAFTRAFRRWTGSAPTQFAS